MRQQHDIEGRGLGYVYTSTRARRRQLAGPTTPTGGSEEPAADTPRASVQEDAVIDVLVAMLAPCRVCGARAGHGCKGVGRREDRGARWVHAAGGRVEPLLSVISKHTTG